MKQRLVVASITLCILVVAFLYGYSTLAEQQAALKQLRSERASVDAQLSELKSVVTTSEKQAEQTNRLVSSYFRSCRSVHNLPHELNFDWILVSQNSASRAQTLFWLPKGEHVLTIQIEDTLEPSKVVSKEYRLAGETGYSLTFPQLNSDAESIATSPAEGLLMQLASNREGVDMVEDRLMIEFAKPKSYSYPSGAPWRLKNQLDMDWTPNTASDDSRIVERAQALGALIASYRMSWTSDQTSYVQFRFSIRSDGPIRMSPQLTRKTLLLRRALKKTAAGDHYEVVEE